MLCEQTETGVCC